MRYLIAIFSTIIMVAIHLIMKPFLQWYLRTCCEPGTQLEGLGAILLVLSLGMLILVILSWVSAIKDKDLKDILE